ncbi:MAG: hypothetical protein MZV70_35005 [Desulfobacterales bacterium]|nr:hypothetical protein [Desulfobacterales bacterium]
MRISGGAPGDGVAAEVAIAPERDLGPPGPPGGPGRRLLRGEGPGRGRPHPTKEKDPIRLRQPGLPEPLGAARAVTSFILGSQAMDAYRAATTTAEAIERREVVETWQALLFTSSGIGLAGLGLTPVFLGGNHRPEELEKSIRALEEGIESVVEMSDFV